MLKIIVILGLLFFAFWLTKYLPPSNQKKVVIGLFSLLGGAAILMMVFELLR